MAKPPPTPPRELSLEEAMSSLGVSEKTIRKYIINCSILVLLVC